MERPIVCNSKKVSQNLFENCYKINWEVAKTKVMVKKKR